MWFFWLLMVVTALLVGHILLQSHGVKRLLYGLSHFGVLTFIANAIHENDNYLHPLVKEWPGVRNLLAVLNGLGVGVVISDLHIADVIAYILRDYSVPADWTGAYLNLSQTSGPIFPKRPYILICIHQGVQDAMIDLVHNAGHVFLQRSIQDDPLQPGLQTEMAAWQMGIERAEILGVLPGEHIVRAKMLMEDHLKNIPLGRNPSHTLRYRTKKTPVR